MTYKIRTMLTMLLFSLITIAHASAQSGSIYGVVHDDETGEELTGANLLLVGTTKGASTDLDGRFMIANVPSGTYDIRVSLVGYATKVVTSVTIGERESLKLDLTLRSQAYDAEEVVVTAERVLSTEASLLSERKKSGTIVDGISAEQIKRTPDATSGDALKRVTGITVVDNKFVFVRGVTDRYNGTMLNGVSVTTTDTDVDKKSFAFDMVPANLLENTVVTKTSTPDLPGDFTGGLVQLNTLDFPRSRVLRISLATSHNSITNLEMIQKSQGGGSDWTGFDDGAREFPQQTLDSYQLGQTLPNTWAQKTSKAPLNGSLNLTLGDSYSLGEDVLGFIAGLSYRNGYQRSNLKNDYFRQGTRILESSGTRDDYTVLWGGLLDFNLKLSGLHKISFKNNFNQTGEDKLTSTEGIDENEQSLRTTVTEWDQRSLYVGKVSGEHFFPGLNNLELFWQGAYISSIAEEPDRKSVVYAKNIYYPEEYPYSNGLGQRSWSNLNEYTRSAGLDLIVPINGSKLKFGAMADAKRRDYAIRFFLSELDRNSTAFELLLLPLDSIYVPANFGPGLLTMSRLDDPRDLYSGEHTLYAGYMMADVPFSLFDNNFRIVGGARLENSEQLVNTISPFSTNEPYIARLKKVDILPSMNLTYYISQAMNFRLAYSHSVNRPEFRELSSFYFYDYSIYEGTFGNPLLQRALAKNYDVRFEVFPGVGELLAVSYFLKDISGAIEQQLIISSNPERTWFNSPRGKNYGWELEVRKSLGFIGDYFANFSVAGNYTRIFSAIEYPVFFMATEYAVREMQGQAPYTINVSFLFKEPTLGTSVSLLYNEFGKRLEAVGDRRGEDIFEEARGVLDASVTQPLVGGLEMKFTIRDWGANLKKYVTREGNPYRTLFFGTTYSLQASLTL